MTNSPTDSAPGSHDVRNAIRNGDAGSLKRLLAEDHALADALVSWGARGNPTHHPLHYVCDMVFENVLPKEKALPLIEALLEAGSSVDFQTREKSDTPLIGAASLGVEDVGLRLLDAGADPAVRGLFGETALHWAAMLGEDRLAARLARGADLDLKDEKYASSPLGWAIHGWCDAPADDHGRQRAVILQLAAAGATIEPRWLELQKVADDPSVRAALQKAAA